MRTKMVILTLLLVAAAMSGCSNKRWYIGVDDYGKTQSHESAWRTGRNSEDYRK